MNISWDNIDNLEDYLLIADTIKSAEVNNNIAIAITPKTEYFNVKSTVFRQCFLVLVTFLYFQYQVP